MVTRDLACKRVFVLLRERATAALLPSKELTRVLLLRFFSLLSLWVWVWFWFWFWFWSFLRLVVALVLFSVQSIFRELVMTRVFAIAVAFVVWVLIVDSSSVSECVIYLVCFLCGLYFAQW